MSESRAAGEVTPAGTNISLSKIASRVVGMSEARVEWGVILARVLLAAGLLGVALTNERTAELGLSAVIASSVPIIYSPILALMVYRRAISSEVVVSAALDTVAVLSGVTWAAWVIAQKVAENQDALTQDQIHQVEHDIYRPMLALVMFVALRLRPTWGAGFVAAACLTSLGLVMAFAGNAFSFSSLAFQYFSLGITGIAAVVVAMFIQQTREELEDALDDRSDLIQTVTHELGNPLAALKASMEMTHEEYGEKLDDDFRRLIRVANNSVGRIESLARNLSALRSVDAHVAPPALSPVVLGGVMQFAVDSMQPLADERDVAISVDIPDQSLVALANHDAVDRILVNLISNAVKFSPVGSTVRIVVRSDGPELLIDVEDEGPGIPDEEKPFLFQRYFRATNAFARQVPGSGLGLYICRELALRMNGSVDVRDRPGGGSVFTLTLKTSAPA